MAVKEIAKNDPVDVLNKTFLLNCPKDAARKIESMSMKDAADILKEQPIYVLEPVWSNLAPGIVDVLLLKLPETIAVQLLVAMDAGPCAALLSRLKPEKREYFLSLLEKSTAELMRELLQYPEDSAGRLMDTRVAAVNKNITVAEAIAQLKNQKMGAFHYLFVLDDNMNLHGRVDMQKLALADNDQTLSSLYDPIHYYATALDPKSEIIEKLQKFNVSTLPVVDGNNRLVGIVHGKNLIADLKKDIAVDMQTMVGVSKDEHALSSPWFAVRKRQPWLQINLLTAFLAAAVVGMFEDTIAKYTALAILLPIAAGQSGNTGAQALAVSMRGLSLREITVRNWLYVAIKEGSAAVVNGIAIAITCGLGVYFWSSSFGLALIIALAMISSMTIAAVSGGLIPIILKRLGQDPALSSSIILTTLTDIAGFMSFLGIATSLSYMLEAG